MGQEGPPVGHEETKPHPGQGGISDPSCLAGGWEKLNFSGGTKSSGGRWGCVCDREERLSEAPEVTALTPRCPSFEGDSPRAQWMLDGVVVTGHPLTTYIALCAGHFTGLAPDRALSQVDRQTQNDAT